MKDDQTNEPNSDIESNTDFNGAMKVKIINFKTHSQHPCVHVVTVFMTNIWMW